MLFLVGNNKVNAHQKEKIHTKKCENENVVPLEKGTAETKSVIPLEKEQQKCKCNFFRKGTTKMKSVIPLEKEQQKCK